MPKWDVRCKLCGKTHAYQWRSVEDRDNDLLHDYLICEDNACLGPLEVVPSAPNFKVGGKFTAKNGYSGR